MGKTAKEEESDGIEIISIGKFYTGPWDKKYWSSSRGKDRYPYPVGYKSVRTQNGVTYTMEILEGLKGPSFTIGSTDGKSCSGDTPDIAWESFQKKGCSKLWHGRRFSCKIDGVEFFGFKNTFVQRLLRELVANVGGTAEQSLLLSNLSSKACETVNQLHCKPSSPDPDLMTFLVKSHVKGKRSRNAKVVDGKRHKQEKCPKNASSSNSKQRDQSNCGSSDPPAVVSANELSGFCYSPGVLGPKNLAAVIENEKYLPIAQRGMRLDSLDRSDHLKVGDALLQEGRELTCSTNQFGINIDNLLQNGELSDRSRYVDIQEDNNLIPEESGGVNDVQQDMPIVNDADLCAPDTLDCAGDSSSVSSLRDNVEVCTVVKDAIVNDASKSELLLTDSLPEDEIGATAYNISSEKCDTESVGQEIAKSMMTVLLPRAVPLLKTFTRKKKKSAKPSIIPNHRSQEENNMPNISMNDVTIAKGLPEDDDLERKNEKAWIPSAGHDSVVSRSGNSDSMVPDTFDNDDAQGLLPHADAAKAGQLSSGVDPCAMLPNNVNAEANPLLCHGGIREQVAGTKTVLAPVKDITANSKGNRFDCNCMDKLPSVHGSSMNGTSRSESIMCRGFSNICMPENSEASLTEFHQDTAFADRDDSSSNVQIPSTSCCFSMTKNKEMNDDSRSNIQQKVKLNSKLQGRLELFTCYVQPMPISMVQLIVKENDIFICVKCGSSELKESTLFVYKTLKNGELMGRPSLIGHVPVAMQISKNVLGRDIAVERSLLQLTPDGQSLVLLNSIKIPYCREGKLHCSCPACTSDCFEKNAVKIVRLNRGYASVVKRLETTQGVCCLLVCEPGFLLAAEEGGKLKLWIMNSEWSGQKEDLYLPTLDCMFPDIVELKTVPKFPTLVVGHNGFGEFCLWDIDKRNLVSRFSSPEMSVLECIPASVFRWQRKGECKIETLVDEIMDATKTWFSEGSENHVFSSEDKDVAVWLLISTVSNPDSQCHQSCEPETDAVGCWRLALLFNNMVITGSVVDAGTAAVTSVGHGIIGRPNGLVYMWELSTGMKLGNLHSFKGSTVSCITTDTTNSGALAIASGGQLLVYLLS